MGDSSRERGGLISLCMIVRNGGAALRQALESARPFMDELIVVDTGSTDSSRDIAVECGARVVEFPWRDDFSAARNFSIDQARGDWIFWMDADDVLPESSGREIRRAVSENAARDAAYWVTVEEQSTDAQGRTRVMAHAHIKLFPRHPQIRFQYRVHEQVAPSIQALGMPLRQTSAVVRHGHADRSEAGERARSDRNLRLALLDLAERPDDPFVLMSVGTTYLFRSDGLPQAIDFLRRSVDQMRPGSQNQLNAILFLGQALGTSGDRDQEEQVYRQALAAFPDDAVLLTRLGGLCERAQRFEEAAQCLQSALDRGKVRVSAVHARGQQQPLVLRLGRLYQRLGQTARAEQLWRDFLAHNPQADAVRQALAQAYGWLK